MNRIFWKTTIMCLLLFAGVLSYGQGQISIEVRTNVNHFSCECNAWNFVLHKNANGKNVIEFPLDAFDCPKRKIEKDLLDLFEAKDYPFIKLVVEKVQEKVGHYQVHINLIIRKTEETYTLKLSEEKINGTSYLTGDQNINLSDFGLEAPVKALGLVKVKDEFKIDFCIPKTAVF